MMKFQTGPSSKRFFVSDKISVTEKLKIVLGRVENIVGKGENAGYLWVPAFSPLFIIFF